MKQLIERALRLDEWNKSCAEIEVRQLTRAPRISPCDPLNLQLTHSPMHQVLPYVCGIANLVLFTWREWSTLCFYVAYFEPPFHALTHHPLHPLRYVAKASSVSIPTTVSAIPSRSRAPGIPRDSGSIFLGLLAHLWIRRLLVCFKAPATSPPDPSLLVRPP